MGSAGQPVEEVFIVKVVEAAIDTSKTPEEAMAIAQRNLLHHWSCETRDQAMTITKKHHGETEACSAFRGETDACGARKAFPG